MDPSAADDSNYVLAMPPHIQRVRDVLLHECHEQLGVDVDVGYRLKHFLLRSSFVVFTDLTHAVATHAKQTKIKPKVAAPKKKTGDAGAAVAGEPLPLGDEDEEPHEEDALEFEDPDSIDLAAALEEVIDETMDEGMIGLDVEGVLSSMTDDYDTDEAVDVCAEATGAEAEVVAEVALPFLVVTDAQVGHILDRCALVWDKARHSVDTAAARVLTAPKLAVKTCLWFKGLVSEKM